MTQIAEPTQAKSNQDDLRNRLRVVEDELLERLAKTEGSQRWLDETKRHLEYAFMCWKRGIYDGKRVDD